MALSAFAARSGLETRQVQMVSLDDLVPADDELRRIEALIDWDHARATARPFYRAGGAGPLGIDPAVLVKGASPLIEMYAGRSPSCAFSWTMIEPSPGCCRLGLSL